jgi:hypothetical protein
MVLPVHGSHLQPSDIGEWIGFATTERVRFHKQNILVAETFGRWVAPAPGILERGFFVCGDNGSGSGPNTMEILKNGTTMLTAAMSIAHDDTDNVEVAASWDGTPTVAEGDIITLVSSAGATAQTGATAGFTFRLLGRS